MSNIVVIGGSAGSIAALKVILAGLPADFSVPVLVVTHIGSHESLLPSLLERCARQPVRHAMQGEPIVAGQVLVAPSDLHLIVARDGERPYVQLSRGPKENHARPAIDPLFRSAAAVYGRGAIGVVLSGFLDDGTVGLQAIKACGGLAVVQDPDDAEVPEMPASATRYAAVDYVRRTADIASTLLGLVGMKTVPPLAEGNAKVAAHDWIAIENRMLNEGTDMGDMDRIGSRVALTCPECGGAIWEINDSEPVRYRCHTGHAFTARVLEALQGDEVEEALWAAVRALHEQEQLFRQRHRHASDATHESIDTAARANEYLRKAEQAKEHAQLLRDLIAARMRIGPV